MNPRRFWGKDMSAALRAVRNSLGPDALILETKNVAEGSGIEITALGGERVESKPNDRQAPPVPSFISAPIEEMRDEIASLRSMLSWLAPKIQKNDVLKSLVGHGVSPEIMGRISEAMRESAGASDREKIYGALKLLIQSGGEVRDEQDRIVLMGPAGVGKTTSLIKLTVFESQRFSRRIGWVNADQRRLSGDDALPVYANILGVRYETAESNKELHRCLSRLSDCDLILIDTPGVSPRDERAMKSLEQLLQDLPDLRRALLCNATTNHADMADWVQAYGRLGISSLFFTKLDECRHLGPLINTAIGSGYPLSYITLGQNLAGDLEIARPEVLSSLLLTGGDPHD